MSRTASSIIRTRFTWLVLRRPDTGSLYIHEDIGTLPVAIVFASGHLSVYNDYNKVFRTYIKVVNSILFVRFVA